MANKESAMFRQIMRQLHKTDDAVEKLIAERVAKETADMGLVRKALAASKIASEVEKEYLIATKGITGERTRIFKMLGINLSTGAQKLLEKKATKDEIEKAKKAFGMDKKEKDKTVRTLSKPLSMIIRNLIDVKKDMAAIKSLLTKPKVRANFVFDPKAAGGGRFRNVETGRLAKASEAVENYGGIGKNVARTAALTKAIMADEDPMIGLKDSMDSLKKSIDDMNIVRLERKVDALSASINPTLLGMAMGKTPLKSLAKMFLGISVHDKLDMLLGKSAIPGINGIPNKPGRPGKSIPKRGPGIGGALAAASGAYLISEAVGAAGPTMGMSNKAVVGTQTAVLGAAGAYAGTQAVKAAAAVKSGGTEFAKRWKKFLVFIGRRNPTLYNLVIKRMVAIGASLGLTATGIGAIPGLISALFNAGMAAWMVYDIINLWKEFNNIPEEKAETPTPTTPGTKAAAAAAPGPAAKASSAGPTATPAELRAVSQMGTAKEAMEYFISRGYSRAQAAGIVGNLLVESNLKTDAIGDKGKAYGIAQWHPDRQALFLKTYGKPIQQATFKEQLAFVDWELNHSEAAAKRKLQNTMGAMEAALVVDEFYERSAGLHVQKRVDFANQLFGSNYAERVEANEGNRVVAPETAATRVSADKETYLRVPGLAAADTSGGVASSEAAVSAADYKAGKRSGAPSIPEILLKNLASKLNEEELSKLDFEKEQLDNMMKNVDAAVSKDLEASSLKNAQMVADFGKNYVPVINTLTDQMVRQSSELEANKESKSTAPIIINQAPATSQQPIQPPKTPLLDAPIRNSESSFMRAISNDFAHPTAFTSVGMV